LVRNCARFCYQFATNFVGREFAKHTVPP